MLLEHAPEPHGEVLQQTLDEVKATFTEARLHVRGYYKQGQQFAMSHAPTAWGSTGVVPMHVNAVRVVGGKAKDKQERQMKGQT